MELKNKYFFDRDPIRLDFEDSTLINMPFQLLPRATYNKKKILESLKFQEEFYKDLNRKPLISVIIYEDDTLDMDSFVKSLESVLVGGYRNVEILLAIKEDREKLEYISSISNDKCLNLTVFTYSEKEKFQIEPLLETSNGEIVLVFNTNTFLHPHTLIILSKELKTKNFDLYYSNEVLVNKDYKAIKYLRKSPLREYNVLSHNQIGDFFVLSKPTYKAIASRRLLSDLDPKFWGWKVSAWALTLKLRAKFIPLGLVLKREKEKTKSREGFFKNEELSSIVKEYSKNNHYKLKDIKCYREFNVTYVRPIFFKERSKIQVIIPFKNKEELTITCLKSLLKQDCLKDLRITLVDNNSSPKSLESVLEKVKEFSLEPYTKVIKDEKYFNYARINNRAIEEENTEYILFLNNDVELEENTAISELLSVMSLPEVKAVGGLLKYENGEVQHGGINFSSIRPENVTSKLQFSFLLREVRAVSFAMCLVKREDYIRAGKLDERYCPNGFSDALFCYRLKNIGGRILYTPFCSAIHRESASRGRSIEEMEFYDLHSLGLEIASLYDDMSQKDQRTYLPLSEIEEEPVMVLLDKIKRRRGLYSFLNKSIKGILNIKKNN